MHLELQLSMFCIVVLCSLNYFKIPMSFVLVV